MEEMSWQLQLGQMWKLSGTTMLILTRGGINLLSWVKDLNVVTRAAKAGTRESWTPYYNHYKRSGRVGM
jgi:hypothetical protein